MSVCMVATGSVINEVCVLWPWFLPCLHGGCWVSGPWGGGACGFLVTWPTFLPPHPAPCILVASSLSYIGVGVVCLGQLACTLGPPKRTDLPQQKKRSSRLTWRILQPTVHGRGHLQHLNKGRNAEQTEQLPQPNVAVHIWVNVDSEVIMSANAY